jgi:hypothetical protein
MFKRILAALGLAAALAASTPPAHAQLLQIIPQLVQQPQQQAQLSCLGDILARTIQAAQQLLNVTQAARAAGLGTPLAGTVRLCTLNGLFVWEFNELGNDGRTQRRVLNAFTGAPVPGG